VTKSSNRTLSPDMSTSNSSSTSGHTTVPLKFRNSIAARERESYITTDGQSASLSWCQAPIWGLRPDFYYCQKIAGLLMWGALSDERTGLSFTMYNVQYVYILHVILRHSFTHLI
jgi:hypothetical protein